MNIPLGIAIDQETGAVYVADYERSTGIIQEFSSDGERILASFGETTGTKDIDEGHPERIAEPKMLAVDAKGTVFLTETTQSREPEDGRVMVFVPKTAADEEYEYREELW